MYIAFKWLLGLTLVMWLAMCLIDFYIKNKEISKRGRTETFAWTCRNMSLQLEQEPYSHHSHTGKLYEKRFRRYDPAVLHYVMFFAGAVAVSVFNKKREIIIYTKNAIAKIDILAATKSLSASLKTTATLCYVATIKYSTILWAILKTSLARIKNFKRGINTNVIEKHKRLNFILINKLKEINEERRKLGQLLIAAIQENKNIKMQFQLENMAKNRLVRHIEDTQQKIKENRSKYVSFQHLYLVTHQENIFLKARIRKLTTEKENAEKDLMEIIDEIYQSKSSDLKAFCNRFIVRPKDNLLNSDVSAEVQKFLRKTCHTMEATTSWQVPPHSSCVTEVLQKDESLVPLVSDSPKLKGLPGEYIWTVKDKDGLIEKLYEYDSDFENGDTIRRIREYSVYFDKDCLLDFASSRTVMADPIPVTLNTLYPTSERFLTGSDAFQKFMQENKIIIPSSRSPLPPLLC